MRSDYQGGENATDWRKSITGLADRTNETVYTHKFGLENADQYINFSDSQKTHAITEGTGKGSLTGLLLALHLSGFRLFAKGSETQGFLNRSRYPIKLFQSALKSYLQIESPNISPLY